MSINQQEINRLLEWYDRYPDRSYFRLISMPPGGKEVLLSNSPTGIGGNKEEARKHLQHELDFHARSQNPMPNLYLRLGTSVNDPSPINTAINFAVPNSAGNYGINGIGNYMPQSQTYTSEYVEMVRNEERMKSKLERLEEKMNEGNNGIKEFALQLLETPAISGLVQLFAARQGVALQGFGNLPTGENDTTPQAEKRSIAEIENDLINPIDANLSELNLGIDSATILEKLRDISQKALNGDVEALNKLDLATKFL